jgi:uncharacterized damage-inducible protein DinB
MTLTEFFLDQLETESAASRKAVARVPTGQAGWKSWKPHEKSMEMGYLANLVATMPGWIELMIRRDELDVAAASSEGFRPPAASTAEELAAACDAATARARAALSGTDDTFLATRWKLLVAGRVVDEPVRWRAIRDVFTHMAHHRGQLTVYLRLNGAAVPSICGPSADEKTFG